MVEKKGFFSKLKDGLSKSRKSLNDKIDTVFKSFKKVDEELFEELEEILITADVGVNATMEIIETLRERTKQEKVSESEEAKELLKDIIKEMLFEGDNDIDINNKPAIILVIGVNGVGKTTTIGKLAEKFKQEGKKVLLAAGDTFRAAAVEQLQIWADRVGVDIIKHSEGSDPAAVIFDAINAAKARSTDILICDTAGRLHNKKNLMNELNKVYRIVDKESAGSSKEVLLVLDATTGQNAVSQAQLFGEIAEITGIVLTKLDGTAKGGITIAVKHEQKIPVKYIGVGEKAEDLQKFNAEEFVDALFE